MWTYNIIREIFLQLNKKIIPLDVPNNDNEMMHCHIKNLDSKEDFISIIKIHKLVKKEYTNKTKMIINIRDPRDAVMSFMRLMKFKNFSFEQTMSFIQGSINLVYHYRTIIDKENLLAINTLVNELDVDFQALDYEKALESSTQNDFCYLDPPYQPEQEGGFTSYTKDSFNEENQLRLSKLITKLDTKHTNVMLSNSATQYIRKLYPKSTYKISEFPTLRAINSDATNRKGSTELVIMNYSVK